MRFIYQLIVWLVGFKKANLRIVGLHFLVIPSTEFESSSPAFKYRPILAGVTKTYCYNHWPIPILCWHRKFYFVARQFWHLSFHKRGEGNHQSKNCQQQTRVILELEKLRCIAFSLVPIPILVMPLQFQIQMVYWAIFMDIWRN